MFESFSRSWELVKASWSVLRSDKELIVFPVISFIGSILVLIAFAIPFLAVAMGDMDRGDSLSLPAIIIGFLFYVVMYTVVFFCNTALVGAAMIRLTGGDPTVRDGFRIASERFGKIVGYAVISATVGMILRAISERSGIIGQIVISIIGFVWSIATFLVVPVLVIEDVGPIDAVKRSAELLKKTWGEQIVGNFGLGAIIGLASFGVMIVGVVLISLFAGLNSPALVILAILVMVAALIGLGLISGALSGIYQAALYRYAADGEVPAGFSPEMVKGAFKEKPKRGLF